jgi:recombination protein RecA
MPAPKRQDRILSPPARCPVDLALGVGGMPRGRVVEIFGPESSGKTTLMLHVIANAQKTGGLAAFIDAEHALDPGLRQKARRQPGRTCSCRSRTAARKP